MKRAVVVFSGGQDSTTCLIQALRNYDEVHCVTFDYGQRHSQEIDVARKLSLKLGAAAHKVLDVSLLNELAVSSLTRDNIPVPGFSESEQSDIPNTFVPGRNILFLTLTAIYAYGFHTRNGQRVWERQSQRVAILDGDEHRIRFLAVLVLIEL